MSSQTHTERVEDAAKKRREYLVVTLQVRTLSTASGLLTLAMFALAVVLLGFAFCNGSFAFWSCVFSFVVALAAIIPAVLWQEGTKDLAAIPYVPPVAEQLAALPAEEILLRGSNPPAAALGELLRAAQEGTTETASEELLRESAMPPTGKL